MKENNEFKKVKNFETEGWEKFRNESNYDLIETFIPAINDNRKIFFTKKESKEYEMLQCSRGISIGEKLKNIKDLEKDIKENQLKIDNRDKLRIEELNNIIYELKNNFKKEVDIKTLCEIGFRIPRLLKHYKDEGCEKVIGYDVVKLNVEIANSLGYETYQRDFNNIENCNLESISNCDIILSYHMLEHISRPDIAIKKIYDSIKKGCFFHVEIPVEPDGPRLRYGHLFPFYPGDMLKMLKFAGFKVLMATNKTHEGGAWIERYFCEK